MNDIAALNDNFRKTFTGGQVLLTAGTVSYTHLTLPTNREV